jgi:hypothetical protein
MALRTNRDYFEDGCLLAIALRLRPAVTYVTSLNFYQTT